MYTITNTPGMPNYPLSLQLGTYPNQKNAGVGTGLGLVGQLVGAYFGGPAGAIGGGIVGRQAGYGLGNTFAGRDFYNGGTGNFWDNFNPASNYGAASFRQSPLSLFWPNNSNFGGLLGGGGMNPFGGGGMNPFGGLLGGR